MFYLFFYCYKCPWKKTLICPQRRAIYFLTVLLFCKTLVYSLRDDLAIFRLSSVRHSPEEAPVEGTTSNYLGFWIIPIYKCRRWEDNTKLFGSGITLIYHLTGLHETKGKHHETWIGTNVYSLAANMLSWRWSVFGDE